jgi:serine/threonine protein kinase
MIGARAAPAQVVSPPRVFVGVAAVVALFVPVVIAIGRHERATEAAALALGGQCLCALALAWSYRAPSPSVPRRVMQSALLVALGGLTAVLGYFFGPNAGFAGVVALALVLTGVVSGGASVRAPTLSGWLTYAALAGGQLGAAAIVLVGIAPDESLTRLIVTGHPMWHHWIAHAGLHVLYLAAFLSGRRFQRRYAAVADEIESSVHRVARQEALVTEARAEYRRTLDIARRGMFSGRSVGEYKIGALLARDEASEVYDAVHAADGTRATLTLAAGDEHVGVTRLEPRGRASSAPPPPLREARENLDRVLERGPLKKEELRTLARDVADAIAAVHARGMVHFGVTPPAIVRETSERGVRFRIAEATLSPPDLGSANALRYLPPERIVGRAADERTDVYGLASVLYAAASGIAPFADERTAADVARAVSSRLPESPERFVHLAAVTTILRIGLAKEPADRFAKIGDLARAFVAALDGELDPALEDRARALDRIASWTPPPPNDAVREPSAPTSPSGTDTVPPLAWRAAYRSKMRGFALWITALCAGGAILLAFVARETMPFVVALSCIAGIVIAAWLREALATRSERVYWPWAIIGVLSVGPAYSLGLHSAFAAAIAIWLFSGGLFRADDPAGQRQRRALVLGGVVLSHTTLFSLIVAGVVPDAGNVPVTDAGSAPFEPFALHALLLAVYASAYAAGLAIDRRYADLARRAQEAARDAARQDALLVQARGELERALARGDGIFTGLLLGTYDVGRLLGRGGMGEVYEATDRRDGAKVALKLIRQDRVADPESLRMFREEAEALSRVESDHVARVLGYSDRDGDVPFIALEFIEGRSLSERLRERNRLSLAEARAMIRDVAAGLADVHAAGVLHCDVKPQNVVETRGGSWKLVDFGVARLSSSGAGSVAGTPAYMAPEQARAARIDARSDLYSLGVVAYRAITGRPAFTGDDPDEVADQAFERGPPDPRAIAALPEDVALALRVAMAPSPDERFRTAAELALAFDRAFDSELSDEMREAALRVLRRRPWA